MDDRVDRNSLSKRLDRIQRHLRSNAIQHAADLAAELRVANIFLNLNGLERLVFDERPDLRCVVRGYNVSIEIRKFRFKNEDVENQKRLEQAPKQGKLIEYGKPAYFTEFVAEALTQKIQEALNTSDYYLYFLSESPHQVEDVEIENALRDILQRSTTPLPVAGLFYQTLKRPMDTSLIRFIILNVEKVSDAVLDAFKDSSFFHIVKIN